MSVCRHVAKSRLSAASRIFHPACQTSRSATTLADKKNIESVGVLGGGITGLATAFYLSKLLRGTPITLIEGSERLGGWLQTSKVDVDGGTVLFEHGPRTLRASGVNAILTVELLKDLGLIRDVLTTAKDSPAARNRYIYYPDRLVRVPGPGDSIFKILATILREPLFSKIIGSALLEPLRPSRVSDEDESVGSFLSRRFNPDLANNLVSAIFHGIYAGDIYKLSARTLLPYPWYAERAAGSVLEGAFQAWMKGITPIMADDFALIQSLKPFVMARADDESASKLEDMKACSVFSLKSGLGMISERIQDVLQAESNVSVCTKTRVERISTDQDGSVMLEMNQHTDAGSGSTNSKATRTFSHLVSTVSGTALAKTLGGRSIAELKSTAVTVMVASLYFREPGLLPVRGFGHLIPRSTPLQENPEWALGVVYDSDTVQGQDTVAGTKITVMMGGHWWDGWTSFPSEDEGLSMAMSVLKRQLGIRAVPVASKVTLQKDCIPQYTLGHYDRMGTIHRELDNRFRGRLCVAGSSYAGVGVNDCVRSAWDASHALLHASTGLEKFASPELWLSHRRP